MHALSTPMRALGALALILAALPALAATRPNVILVMSDDQGYGELSAHGNPVLHTPNLDKLHVEAIRFTDFHAAPMARTSCPTNTAAPSAPRWTRH